VLVAALSGLDIYNWNVSARRAIPAGVAREIVRKHLRPLRQGIEHDLHEEAPLFTDMQVASWVLAFTASIDISFLESLRLGRRGRAVGGIRDRLRESWKVMG
jgi:hypothetical protein